MNGAAKLAGMITKQIVPFAGNRREQVGILRENCRSQTRLQAVGQGRGSTRRGNQVA